VGLSLNKVVAGWVPGAGALLLWAALAVPATAQDDDAYAADVVRCQSRGLEWNHCEVDVTRGVELVRQLSEASCVRGSQWGTDRTGIWVSLGCRAEFRVRSAAPGSSKARLVRRVVRCESNGRPQSCPVRLDGADVRLLRQTGVMPCRQEQTWGYRRNEIWTTRGCQGDFEVAAADGSGFVDVPRRLSCDSKDRRRRFCGATITQGATLLKQRSGSACVEGSGWGWDRFGVWVDNGCRADFSVN